MRGHHAASGGWPKPLSPPAFSFARSIDAAFSFFFLSLSLSLSRSLHLLYPPVFDVDTSATLQGLPLMTRCADLRIVPACCGYVSEAPDSDDSKWTSWCSSSDCFTF